MTRYVRGTVVVVRLDLREGGEKRDTRPCLVVQNDSGNESSPLTIVVPLTNRDNMERRSPLLVAVSTGEGGLDVDSVADCGLVMTIKRSHIVEIRQKVSDATMAEVERALRVSLGL